MKLAAIVPPTWRDRFPPDDYYMALAPWLVDDQAYKAYVRHLKFKGVHVILDNGAFEGNQVALDVLTKVVAEVAPATCVLPDVIGNGQETLERSWEFVSKHQPIAHEVMFVPQGTTLQTWKECLMAWLENWLASSWNNHYQLVIGINALRSFSNPAPTQRADAIIFASRSDLPLHLLGIGDIPIFLQHTLPVALTYNVKGIDTSVPFALGAAQELLTPYVSKVPLGAIRKYDRLSTKQQQGIDINISVLKIWCQGARDASVR